LPETFTAIDSGSVKDVSTWTTLGTHHAEAGFEDPSLGWVAVRAQGASGAIHATVVPSTAEAAEVLGGHMSGLNAYMAGQPAHVVPVSLGTPEASDGRSMAQGQGQNQDHSGYQPEQKEAGPGSPYHASAASTAEGPANIAPVYATVSAAGVLHVSVRV
jgi:hypothetical protein